VAIEYSSIPDGDDEDLQAFFDPENSLEVYAESKPSSAEN
jgi:hypothetical protein